MMRIIIIAFVLLSLPCMAEIYKWTDASGKIHFGDRPPDKNKAKKINVKINSIDHVTYERIDSSKATSSNRVTMYSTSWCGYCKKARAYFKANNISYVDYDIEKDMHAKRIYDSLGSTGVPVILIGKTKMQGFNASTFERIYKGFAANESN